MVLTFEEWIVNVSANKHALDKKMFDDLIKVTKGRLEREGFEPTWRWLDQNYIHGIGHKMVGPALLAKNSKEIKDKLYSLQQRGEL